MLVREAWTWKAWDRDGSGGGGRKVKTESQDEQTIESATSPKLDLGM